MYVSLTEGGQLLMNKVIQKMANVPKDKKERDRIIRDIKQAELAAKIPEQIWKSKANTSKLPEKLKLIIERAEHDSEYLKSIKNIIDSAALTLINHAQEHQTFCDKFRYPNNLHQKLLKIYGVSERELAAELAKIGFYSQHRTYNHPFYQALVIAYAIGLYTEDVSLRQMSLLLMLAKEWNNSISNSFPNGCDPDIARYVVNYMIKNNSKFYKYKTPYSFIVDYYVAKQDLRLPQYLRQDLANPIMGLKKILDDNYANIRQLVTQTIARKYYEAYENGWKEVSVSTHDQAYGDGEMVESRDTFRNVLDQLVDKFNKNQMMAYDVIMQNDAKQAIIRKFSIKPAAIEKLNEFFNDDENHDDLRMATELLIHALKPKNEEEFCSLNIDAILTKVGNAKKNEYMIKFNKYRKQITETVFDKSKVTSQSTWYRLESIVLYSLLIYIKKLTCSSI